MLSSPLEVEGHSHIPKPKVQMVQITQSDQSFMEWAWTIEALMISQLSEYCVFLTHQPRYHSWSFQHELYRKMFQRSSAKIVLGSTLTRYIYMVHINLSGDEGAFQKERLSFFEHSISKMNLTVFRRKILKIYITFQRQHFSISQLFCGKR